MHATVVFFILWQMIGGHAYARVYAFLFGHDKSGVEI